MANSRLVRIYKKHVSKNKNTYIPKVFLKIKDTETIQCEKKKKKTFKPLGYPLFFKFRGGGTQEIVKTGYYTTKKLKTQPKKQPKKRLLKPSLKKDLYDLY